MSRKKNSRIATSEKNLIQMSEYKTDDGTVIEITKETDAVLTDFEFIPRNGNLELFAKVDGKTRLVHKNIYKIKQ